IRDGHVTGVQTCALPISSPAAPSNNATLNVAAGITTQPINHNGTVGGSASFTVVASANAGASLSYQWKKDGVNLGNVASHIAGESGRASCRERREIWRAR